MSQFFEQRPRLLQVLRVKAFGEPSAEMSGKRGYERNLLAPADQWFRDSIEMVYFVRADSVG